MGFATRSVKTVRRCVKRAVRFGNAAAIGTDWTANAAMKGLYLFEASPGLEQDSSGKDNHIDGATSADPPTVETTIIKQGAQSALYSPAGIDDTSILKMSAATADFPMNGTGDAEVTIAGWFRFTSVAGTDYVYNFGGGSEFWFLRSAVGSLMHRIKGSGTTTVTGRTVLINTWYFIGCTYSDSGNVAAVYVRAEGENEGDVTYDTLASAIGTILSLCVSMYLSQCVSVCV